MNNKLTAKQKNILQGIRELIEQHHEHPTSYRLHKFLTAQGVEESMKSIMQVIEALEKKDIITRDEQRRIYLVENESYGNMQNILSIPLYGLASCGEALAYADDVADDFLQLSKSLFYKEQVRKMFAVKALGDSMNKANINDGDYVIFEKVEAQDCDFEGKIVVAVINGMATIKRYKKVQDGVVGLFPQSTNPTHHPIFLSEADTAFVAGVFKRVLPVQFVSL